MTATSSSTDIEDVVPQAQSAAMTAPTVADYSTDELLAEVRQQIEAHWKIRLRDDLTTKDIIGLAQAMIEEQAEAVSPSGSSVNSDTLGKS